jgi:putative aminopeptidase FrvX
VNQARLKFLFDLLRQPTAPFREQQVRACAEAALDQWGVPHGRDPHGNLLVGVRDENDYRRLLSTRSSEPVRLFIAHMDHPGFHGARWLDERTLAIRWHGGSPVKHLNGARVWLSAGDGYLGEGRLRHIELHPKGYAIQTAEVRCADARLHQACPHARRLYGGFAFRAPVWRSGQRLYTKAADDLVGVFAILQTAYALHRKRGRRRPPFIGLLTRAEEVGFVGAIAHLELGWTETRQRPLVAVSLEASRTLPGARIGKGPVVRLGDRRTVFSADGMQLLSELAERVLPQAHQRRIMDGGACEATATTAYGIPTVGLTVPLGNYHNQGLEGGADCPRAQGPAPEFVHLDDVQGLLSLCQALMDEPMRWDDPWARTRQRLQKNRRHYARLLGAERQ